MTQTAAILVVDDEVNIRNALVTMLEKKGHRVHGVGTGEEALHHLEEVGADLVITDLKMPGMGGWNSCAVSRRTGPTRWPS